MSGYGSRHTRPVFPLRVLYCRLPDRGSADSIDKSVNSFNALKIHEAVKHNVDALERQILTEKLGVEIAEAGSVEGGDFGGEGGEHCLSVWWGLPLTP